MDMVEFYREQEEFRARAEEKAEKPKQPIGFLTPAPPHISVDDDYYPYTFPVWKNGEKIMMVVTEEGQIVPLDEWTWGEGT